MTETHTDNIQELDQRYYLQVYKRLPLTLVRGEGSRVWDSEGNEYIDALAGIAVNSLGHCPPRVVEALRRQVGELIHISNFYVSPPQAKLAERLALLSGLDRVFLCNSGAEALEAAFKLGRKYAHAHDRGGTIISMTGCFHGRTLGTIAAGKEKYQRGFEPIPEGFRQVPFNDIDALSAAVDKDTAAVVIEPVQGEGGVRAADPSFMREVRALCNERNIVLIFDEVQCGIGRTGAFFAFEHYDVRPDMLTLAKALGSGFPIGAVVASQKIADAITYGEHGTTFGGNPPACAAALATIDVIEEESLARRAADLGARVVEKLRAAAEGMDEIREVRGMGLMIGVDLAFPGKEVVNEMLRNGVLANCTEETVIRLVPPLNIPEEDMNRVVETLLNSIRKVKENG